MLQFPKMARSYTSNLLYAKYCCIYTYCVACISSLLKDLGNDRRLPTLKRLSILGHFWLSWLSSKRTKMVLLYSGIFENRTLDSNIRKFLFLLSCQIYQRCLCFLRNTCGTTYWLALQCFMVKRYCFATTKKSLSSFKMSSIFF